MRILLAALNAPKGDLDGNLASHAAMLEQVHVGDKVKVRIENVNGTMTIVKLVKAS